jgi:hypothetical protein
MAIRGGFLMRLIAALFLVVTLLAVTPLSASAFGSEGHYGKAFRGGQRADVTDIKASPRAYAGKRVRLRGTVTDVCKNSGCWLVVSDGDSQVKVTIANHAFSVPTDIEGSRVIVEGVVTRSRGRRPVVSVVASGVEVR